jgi:uncharacterized repeat protein (TIGR01451 family)
VFVPDTCAAPGDVAIALVATPDPVRPGELVSYTVTVSNRTASTINTWYVTATIPEHVTVAKGDHPGGSCSTGSTGNTCYPGETISWLLSSIAGGQSLSVTFAALVDSASPPASGTLLRSTATVTAPNAAAGATADSDVVVGADGAVMSVAVSRKVHGATGTFDLPLNSVATNPTTEPRIGPTHTIVFVFDKPVTGGNAVVTEGVATAGTPTFSSNEMRLPLTGVANQQYVTVTVANVAAADGTTGGTGSVRIGFLAGDVNQNRVVTLSDLGQVNAQVAQTVTAANYLKDVNASGTLSLADKGLANQQLTKALPAP